MEPEIQPERDLFGNPVVVSAGRGRPKHEKSAENENKIKMLLMLGWSNERIASAIGISVPTMRKNYFRVLKLRDHQRDAMMLEKAMKLWERGMEGNVAALNAFDALVEKNDLALMEREFRGPDKSDDQPKEKPIGKKEQAQMEAEAVVTDQDDTWGDDLSFGTGPSLN